LTVTFQIRYLKKIDTFVGTLEITITPLKT